MTNRQINLTEIETLRAENKELKSKLAKLEKECKVNQALLRSADALNNRLQHDIKQFDSLKAENQELKASVDYYKQLNSIHIEALDMRDKYAELDYAKAQINILNEAIGRLTANRVANDNVVIIAKSELGDMIKELQNAKSK